MLWDLSTVADHVGEALAGAEAALRLEQAVYGLDWMEERAMQALIADGLAKRYAVAREVHYPSTVGRKLTHRPRCDLVLTPAGRPLKLDSSPPTLFDPPDLCPATQALWVEVKVASQFKGPDVRHSGYGAQWRNAVVEDLRKMEAEEGIREAALLLIVHNASEEVLDRDLALFEDLLAAKEVLAGFRQVRSIPILNRMGHNVCTAALWPTLQRGGPAEPG
jgi:hypothetical protein